MGDFEEYGRFLRLWEVFGVIAECGIKCCFDAWKII
jgi:hypothetical protein